MSCVLQNSFRNRLFARRLRSLVIAINCSLKFRINMRVLRKRCAARRIEQFITDFFKSRTQVVIKRYIVKIRICQRTIRSFLAVNRGRVQLAMLLWEKYEKIARRRLAQQELLLEIARQKAAEKQVRISTAVDSAVHLQWQQLDNRVHRLLRRMQKAQTKSLIVDASCSGKQLSLDEARRTIAMQFDQRKHVCLNLQRIDHFKKLEIISANIRMKRRLFVGLSRISFDVASSTNSSWQVVVESIATKLTVT